MQLQNRISEITYCDLYNGKRRLNRNLRNIYEAIKILK